MKAYCFKDISSIVKHQLHIRFSFHLVLSTWRSLSPYPVLTEAKETPAPVSIYPSAICFYAL